VVAVAVIVVVGIVAGVVVGSSAHGSNGSNGSTGSSSTTVSATAYSCASAAACAIGGGATVELEVGGLWRTAATLPAVAGLAQLEVNDLACPTPSACTAVGNGTIGGTRVAVVADERAGTWRVSELPGLSSLGATTSSLDHLECPAAGECTAAGTYRSGGSASSAHSILVATEHHGTWAPAATVPGLAAAASGGTATTDEAVTCAAPGDCATVGEVTPRTGGARVIGFVAEEVAGTWRPASFVSGGTKAPFVELEAVACPASGWCVAGGREGTNPNGYTGWGTAVVVPEHRGAWTPPVALGPAGGIATYVDALVCPAIDACIAGGGYTPGSFGGVQLGTVTEPFAATERAVHWPAPYEFPDIAQDNIGAPSWIFPSGNGGAISTLSCSAPGTCLAGGYVTTGVSSDQSTIYRRSFTTPIRAGVWGRSRLTDDLVGAQCFPDRSCAVLLQARPDDATTYVVTATI
jgi:hypothetical protein